MEIFIGKPYIEFIDEKAKLCSKISFNGGSKTLYYEVENEYGVYLDDSRSDSFILGLLNHCLYEGIDIVSEIGVTSNLLFSIREHIIPVITKKYPDLKPITIKAEPIEPLKTNAGAVGTGNSGGIDSFYTILKYHKTQYKNLNLTHVLFNNISTNDNDEERIRTLFNRDLEQKRISSEYLGLKFISLYSNLYSFYRQPGIFNHHFCEQYLSAVYALGKLFSVYYFSSSYQIYNFSIGIDIKHKTPASYEFFSLDMCSTPSLRFILSGLEASRTEKTSFVIKEGKNRDFSSKFLQVCSVEQSANNSTYLTINNCGYCNKCARTILILYGKNLLGEYSSLFELKHFYKNKAKFIGRYFAMDKTNFVKEIRCDLRKKHLIPIFTNFYFILYRIRYTLAKNKRLVRFYHFLKKRGK